MCSCEWTHRLLCIGEGASRRLLWIDVNEGASHVLLWINVNEGASRVILWIDTGIVVNKWGCITSILVYHNTTCDLIQHALTHYDERDVCSTNTTPIIKTPIQVEIMWNACINLMYMCILHIAHTPHTLSHTLLFIYVIHTHICCLWASRLFHKHQISVIPSSHQWQLLYT